MMGELVTMNGAGISADELKKRGGGSGNSGDGEPPMEARITRLEEDMAGVKTILARMEPMLVRMDERLKNTATKEDVASRPTTGSVIGIAAGAIALAALILGIFMALPK